MGTYIHYRIEESAGQYYFPWVGLYVTEQDARREMEAAAGSGHANPHRLCIVRYDQTGWEPPKRTEVMPWQGRS